MLLLWLLLICWGHCCGQARREISFIAVATFSVIFGAVARSGEGGGTAVAVWEECGWPRSCCPGYRWKLTAAVVETKDDKMKNSCRRALYTYVLIQMLPRLR